MCEGAGRGRGRGRGSDLVFDNEAKDSGQQVAHSYLKTTSTATSQTARRDTKHQQEERKKRDRRRKDLNNGLRTQSRGPERKVELF